MNNDFNNLWFTNFNQNTLKNSYILLIQLSLTRVRGLKFKYNIHLLQHTKIFLCFTFELTN
jgi:hypothetical protein